MANKHSVVIATSGFRPTFGGDEPIFELTQLLASRGIPTAGVISNKCPVLEHGCAERGLHWLRFPTDILKGKVHLLETLRTSTEARCKIKEFEGAVRALGGEFCLLYFAPWVPNSFQELFPMGCINFHPAPLPQLRGFFPECFAILDGLPEMGGTLHQITERFDEGPVYGTSPTVPIRPWETPESLIMRVSQAAVPFLADSLPRILDGSLRPKDQQGPTLLNAMGANLYPFSWANFETDTHGLLHRKFQVFRGQDTGMALKAKWGGRSYKILDWWLYEGDYPGRPGQSLGIVEGYPVVRTREGVCLLTASFPFPEGSLENPIQETSGDHLVDDQPRKPPFPPASFINSAHQVFSCCPEIA